MRLLVAMAGTACAMQHQSLPRRSVLAAVPALLPACVAAEEPATVVTPSGLRVQDFKVGTGESPRRGQRVTVDYVMQTSGARYGSKIYSTKDAEEPFSFRLGDDDVIEGLQEAVAGMAAGGIRRAYIPSSLGYTNFRKQPQPPTFAEFQRFKNIYLNENRPYQPDVILDIKLFKFKAAS